jgi:GH18 family chitinase
MSNDQGFCGTTKEFVSVFQSTITVTYTDHTQCGDKTVKHPSCDKDLTTLDRVVGYYESWASRRPCNAFWPEQIPTGVYTHINFAFAAIDPVTFEVRPGDSRDLDLLMRVTQLKTLDPDLKVMIALGGWTFNDPGPTQTTFSDIARSKDNQQKFFKSLISFLSTHNLDGVDLDWEYPVAADRSGRSEDYANFPTFLANLKSALDSSGGRNELSITLPASYWYLQNFDIVKLANHVDFFNIMSYDLHGKWDLGNKWTGAYLNAHTNLTEVNKALELLWRNNIDSSKVVMGLAFYARAYTLADAACVEPGCIFTSGANMGSCSREVGILLNNEIDQIVADRGLTATFYDDAAVEVLHWDNQWLSYDDAKTLELKVQYARGSCLGGVMVWAISHDTQDGKYSKALGNVTSRTTKTIPGLFLEISSDVEIADDPYETKIDSHLQCKWSNCGEFCPAGWQMVMRDDKWATKENELMLDDTACTSPHDRRLCCPPSETVPTCGWYSFNGGKCKGSCPTGYREVGSNQNGCRHGYQAACCTMGDSNQKLLNATRLYESCDWAEAPMCRDGICTFAGSPWPTEFVESTTGSGAAVCNIQDADLDKATITIQKRKYCCDTSDIRSTWGQCTWRSDIESFGTKGQFCKSGCKSNEIKVAMEGGEDCYKNGGAKSYCCTGLYETTQDVLIPELAEYESGLAAWIDNPVCDASTGLDLYARSDLTRRQQTPLKDSQYLVVLHLLAKMIRVSAAGTTTKILKALKNIVDKYIEPKWSNLTSDNIINWANNATLNPTAKEYSPEQWASKILCDPDRYNTILSADYFSPSHVCVNPCSTAGSSKRSLRDGSILLPRRIEQSEDSISSDESPSLQPSWGEFIQSSSDVGYLYVDNLSAFIVDGILNNEMTLVYEQVIRLRNRENEQILESMYLPRPIDLAACLTKD